MQSKRESSPLVKVWKTNFRVNQMKDLFINLKRRAFAYCEIFIKFPLHLVYFLSGFFPRDQKAWVFGCWNGRQFRGNSRFLYEYVRDHHPEIRAVWLVKKKSLLENLRQKSVDAHFAFGLSGIWLTLRAKYFIVTHGICDVNEYVSRRGCLINLTHVIYPIKDMKIPDSKGKSLRDFLRWFVGLLRHPYSLLVKPDYAITSSEFTQKATQHHYRIPLSRIPALGTPKTDFLLNKKENRKLPSLGKEIESFCLEEKKRILFLPTWRSQEGFSLFHYDFDAKALDHLLQEIGAVIAFNFHPFTAHLQKIPDFKGCSHIYCFHSNGDTVNELLPMTDMLITDYSSVFADFLIYDKPLIFAQFDHEWYVENRGLFVDYNDLPGYKATNWPELLGYIKEAFTGKDIHAKARNEMRKAIYPYLDGRARERIVNFILSLPSSK